MLERKNVVAAAAVLVLFGVASWLRPDSPQSFHSEFATVAAQERELLNRYTAASADFKAGLIDDSAFANITEREVLKPYVDVQREVEELKSHPDADTEFLAQVGQFMMLRAEGWGLLVEALREQDREKLRRYEQKMGEAVAIARGLVKARKSGDALSAGGPTTGDSEQAERTSGE
jgi:hypothetical protein